jgi:hypothetical protein
VVFYLRDLSFCLKASTPTIALGCSDATRRNAYDNEKLSLAAVARLRTCKKPAVEGQRKRKEGQSRCGAQCTALSKHRCAGPLGMAELTNAGSRALTLLCGYQMSGRVDTNPSTFVRKIRVPNYDVGIASRVVHEPRPHARSGGSHTVRCRSFRPWDRHDGGRIAPRQERRGGVRSSRWSVAPTTLVSQGCGGFRISSHIDAINRNSAGALNWLFERPHALERSQATKPMELEPATDDMQT